MDAESLYPGPVAVEHPEPVVDRARQVALFAISRDPDGPRVTIDLDDFDDLRDARIVMAYRGGRKIPAVVVSTRPRRTTWLAKVILYEVPGDRIQYIDNDPFNNRRDNILIGGAGMGFLPHPDVRAREIDRMAREHAELSVKVSELDARMAELHREITSLRRKRAHVQSQLDRLRV